MTVTVRTKVSTKDIDEAYLRLKKYSKRNSLTIRPLLISKI